MRNNNLFHPLEELIITEENQPKNKIKDYRHFEELKYEELKKEFPNFTDYLIRLYPDLKIISIRKKSKTTLGLYVNNTLQSLPLNIGTIESYFTEKKGVKDVIINKKKFKDVIVTERGYKAQVLIEGEWHNLKYRKGYECLDFNRFKVISVKDPFRYDKTKDIPFP